MSLVKDGDPRLPNHLLERSARQRVATKADRQVEQTRAKKAEAEKKIAASIAQGKKLKAKAISITKARKKAREAVSREVAVKVAAVTTLQQKLVRGKAVATTSSASAYASGYRSEQGYAFALDAAIPDLPSPTPSCSSSPQSDLYLDDSDYGQDDDDDIDHPEHGDYAHSDREERQLLFDSSPGPTAAPSPSPIVTSSTAAPSPLSSPPLCPVELSGSPRDSDRPPLKRRRVTCEPDDGDGKLENGSTEHLDVHPARGDGVQPTSMEAEDRDAHCWEVQEEVTQHLQSFDTLMAQLGQT